MDKTLERFAQEIKFKLTKSFEHVRISKAALDQSTSIFTLEFQSLGVVPFSEMEPFLKAINNNFKYKAKVEFIVSSIVYEHDNIKQYLAWIVNDFLAAKTLAHVIEKNHSELKDDIFTLEIASETHAQQFRNHTGQIERIMHKFGFDAFRFQARQKNISADSVTAERAALVASGKAALKSRAEVKKVATKTDGRNNYTSLSLDELASAEEKNVAIEGEVFSNTLKTTKTELTISEIGVTDYQEAVAVKIFNRTPLDASQSGRYAPGEWIRVMGEYQIDAYSKEPVIIARKIELIAKPVTKREDKAEIKRVEFSARTRLSTMDGIASAEEYVLNAKKWGHEAIAIIDSESVQAFPEFQKAATKNGIKAIYGSTFNTVNRDPKAIINHKIHQSLLSDAYVVFDLETTGLSPIHDDIIEFGAVKIVGNQVEKSERFFIKPHKQISAQITRLTGITSEMVKDGISIAQALPKILAFFGSATLVAHNSSFDINFINQKLHEQGQKPLTNAVVDTMIVARMLQPESSRFRLENIAVRYGFTYDSTVAHRADYDADLLSKIWLRMIGDLQSKGIATHDELKKYNSADLSTKAFKKEVTLIAKNQSGLKELFKLVSTSHTTTFFGTPALYFEDLAKRKNVLLGSGALRSRVIDMLFFGSEVGLVEEIKNYDYIEILPPRAFTHYENKGFTKAEVEKALSHLISLAQKLHKPVIAISDARYIDEKHKIFHEVYINAKGLGGVRHYLFEYDNSNQKYPLQNLLTTDEMLKQFAFLKDEALINEIVVNAPRKLAASIEEVQVIKPGLHAPIMDDVDQKLVDVVYERAKERYGQELPPLISARLAKELNPIKKYGFSVIYWIAHLLVKKSLNDGYLVGSRGSVGSSLVATLANITEVNPLPPHYVCMKCKTSHFPEVHLNSGYDLPDKTCDHCGHVLHRDGQNIPFETFLGFNADKTPDIDLNFSGAYQQRIHNEVRRLFGDTHTFRAGTISTVADKTAFGYVLSWAENHQRKISRAFTDFIARGVAGTKRTTGQHPGGIIVVPKQFDVEDFTPINFPADDIKSEWKTTHFDFEAIHDNLLKLDLLGHDDPTAIKMLEEITKTNAKRDIPFYDEKIISLFNSTSALEIDPAEIGGETVGVLGIPEFGTRFVRSMLRKAKVTSFGDLIALSGLSHGTNVWATNAEILVMRHNKTLNDVISCRDNIMTDLIAKKIEPIVAFEIMEQVRKGKSITSAQETMLKKHNVEEWYIDSLKKIKYMFPKAHATAYVMMAWRIAWYKIYYPLAFYAVYFSTRADVFELETVINGKKSVEKRLHELDNMNKVNGKLSPKETELIPILEIANEAYARKINIANIDLEKSEASRWVLDEKTNTLYPPFISLDGLGVAVAESIIKARAEKAFTSLEDFKKRTSTNNTVFEKLISLKVFKSLTSSDQLTLDLF